MRAAAASSTVTASVVADESLERGVVGSGHDGHGIGELRDALGHGVVHEPHAARRDHVADGDAAARVRAAGTEEHDGARLHLDELHGGPGRCHRKADADDPRRHVASAEPGAHPLPQDRLKRSKLGEKGGKEEEVAAHARLAHGRVTLYLSPRTGCSLASSGRAD